MSQQQNFTTLYIQDPNGGQPQMIKVLGGGKIPIQLSTTSTGGAPTIRRIIKTSAGEVGSIYHDGKTQNRQLIAMPAKQTMGVPGIRGPLVVPINSVHIKAPTISNVDDSGVRGGPPTISAPLIINSQTGTINVPSISTSVPGQLQSSTKFAISNPMLQAQLKHIVNPQLGISVKPQTVQIQKPSEVRVQHITREQVKPTQSQPVYREVIQTQDNNSHIRHMPQNTPGSPPKTMMNTSILDHSGTRKRHEIDFDYNVAGKRRKTEKGGKGLRHFSMKVCEKVKAKGTTSYNEVADELVTEFTESNRSSATETVNYDQKNIRRRVYDALNVLMAMNIISKEKKEIKWLGLPTNSAQECYKLEQEHKKIAERIQWKTQQLQDLILQQIAFKNLVERNRARERESGGPFLHTTIQLPFIIVNTSDQTVIDCSISDDKRDYTLNFDNTFEIHDDIEVLKKMGMALGLENGKCSPEVLETAKKMVPKALEEYVVDLAKNGAISTNKTSTELGSNLGSEEDEDELENVEARLEAMKEERGCSRGALSRHSSLGSLTHEIRTESETPSSFGDFEDQDSDMETS